MSKYCIICGNKTSRPIAAAIEHFRFIDWSQRHYVRGNFKAFGCWGGFRANITLMFPFLNTLLNWRHRKSRLDLEAE